MEDGCAADRVGAAIGSRVFELLSDELMFHPENLLAEGYEVELTADGEPNVYPLFIRVDGQLFEVEVDVSVSRSRRGA